MPQEISETGRARPAGDQVVSLRADWSFAYEITHRPGDALPFRAVPRDDPGALLQAPTVAGLRSMISADHSRRVAARPGGLASLTAASLTAAGLEVTGPDAADDDGGGRLVIACQSARCDLVVSDSADAELHWSPFGGDAADPHRVADLAATLLSGQPGARHPGAASGDITFKGIVGMDLRAAGFEVELSVYPDETCFDVTAEIVVMDPRAEISGIVYATDDGGLTWYRDYWDEYAETAWQPGFRAWLPDPSAVARAIAGTVSRALSVGVSHDMPAAC
jgi:hypothetical protein